MKNSEFLARSQETLREHEQDIATARAAARNAALEEAAARVERLSAKYALSHPAVAADLRGLAMSLMDEAAIRALIERESKEG